MPVSPKFLNARSATLGRLGFAPRRGTAAFSSRPAEEMGQPQDGAIPEGMAETSLTSMNSRSREPEDARLTGGTRSLMRRVLGLNVTRPVLKPVRSAAASLRGSSLPAITAA